MIYIYSLGRAARYYGERIALSISGKRLTFRELHDRVERIAADLNRRGLRTGDRRLEDMIISGGEKVYCGEVEAVIYEIPAVREAAVFGIPVPRRGELVAARVVLQPGVSLSEQELIRHCQQSLPDYKIPRLVEFRKTDLPKTAVGNVLKLTLREHFRSGSDRGGYTSYKASAGGGGNYGSHRTPVNSR